MDYVIAASVSDALTQLRESQGKARILAGGTDLILDIEAGKRNPQRLIDVMRIPELKTIEISDHYLDIGSAVTLTEIHTSALVRAYFPSLARGCATVGSRLIQNTATLAGNVISAQPAADAGMALSVLSPIFIVAAEQNVRELDVDAMYAGFGKSAIDSSRELLTKIRIPLLTQNEAASFQRLELRKSLSLPMLNAAALINIENGIFQRIHVRMAPVGVGPVRAVETEEWLKGREVSQEAIEYAGNLALKNANPRSNPLRGSREYREMTLPVIVKRAIQEATEQVYGTGKMRTKK